MKIRIKRLLIVSTLLLAVLSLKSSNIIRRRNYHPHDDKDQEKIKKDIMLMKAGGLSVVRMGHLAWDSYEPSEGKFDFKWFDFVMDMMNKAALSNT